MPVTPPICRVCGVAHWLRQPHQFSKSSKASDPSKVLQPKTVKAEGAPLPAVPSARKYAVSTGGRRAGKTAAMAAAAAAGNGGASAGRSRSSRLVPPESPASVPAVEVLAQAEAGAAHLAPKPKSRAGRKPTGFDKAEYDRQYAAKRREAKKAGKLKPKKKPARKAKA